MVTASRFSTLSGEFVDIEQEATANLRMALHGPLLMPGDAAYDEARIVYNGMFDKHPGAIVRCHAAADVVDAVNFARENNLVVAVRGGGHNVAGNSVCDDGLVIDLTELNGVFVDRKTSRVRAQGGATWGDVDREAQAFGLAVPGGVVSTTGIAGLTLSGGLGWLRNKYGLSCDNLLSAEVVTAGGEVVTASETENADLFWALRGGGGNFGVVTSFEFQAHPVGPIVAAALPFYDMKDAGAVLRQWREWVATTPDEVTPAAFLWTVPASEHMPEPLHNRDVLILPSIYSGSIEEGEPIVAPARSFGTPIFDMSGPIPFRMLQSAFDWVFPKGNLSSYWKSLYVNEMTDDVVDIVVEAAQNRSAPLSIINIPYMGGGVRSVAPDATAIAERSAPFMISLDANWPGTGDNAEHRAWARTYWSKLEPHSTGSVYHNFVGQEDEDAEVVVRSGFGANYRRLAQIKAKYDPTNLFRLNQNVKPEA